MRLRLLSVVLTVVTLPAYADPVTFAFSNLTTARGQVIGGTGFTPAGTGAGTIVIDTATGLAENIDVTFALGSSTYRFATSPVEQFAELGPNGFGYVVQYNETDTFGGTLVLALNTESLIGYQGGALCTYGFFGNPCTDLLGDLEIDGTFGVSSNTVYGLAAGSLVLPTVTATPEPPSFVLLASGLLCIASFARRRVVPPERHLDSGSRL